MGLLFPQRLRRQQQAAFCLGALANLATWWYVR
jgi:hypothetical protein